MPLKPELAHLDQATRSLIVGKAVEIIGNMARAYGFDTFLAYYASNDDDCSVTAVDEGIHASQAMAAAIGMLEAVRGLPSCGSEYCANAKLLAALLLKMVDDFEGEDDSDDDSPSPSQPH